MSKRTNHDGNLKGFSAIPQPKQKEKAPSNAYFTRHKNGGTEFTDPKHGDPAWKSGKEYRYDGITNPPGFVSEAEFQRNKSERLGRPDHHITTLDDYRAMEKPGFAYHRTHSRWG